MSGAGRNPVSLSIAAGLLFAAHAQGIAGTAQFPIDDAYGTPLGCALYKFGGRLAVVSGGTGERPGEFFKYDRGEYAEDDALLLVEPTALTSIELECIVADSRGNDVDLDCRQLDIGDDDDDIVTVRAAPTEAGLELHWGNNTYSLEPCLPTS